MKRNLRRLVEIGGRLAPLRDENVLICSGNLVQNPHAYCVSTKIADARLACCCGRPGKVRRIVLECVARFAGGVPGENFARPRVQEPAEAFDAVLDPTLLLVQVRTDHSSSSPIRYPQRDVESIFFSSFSAALAPDHRNVCVASDPRPCCRPRLGQSAALGRDQSKRYTQTRSTTPC